MSSRTRALTIADVRMEMVARVASIAALLVVLASFVYSFSAIKWVSDELGADPEVLSYAFPFIIDLPALVASALTVALHDRTAQVRRYAWSVLTLFTTLSWVCNAIHAARHETITDTVPNPWGTVLVVAIAGFPPLGVVLGMHLWAFALQHSASADLRADGTRAPTPNTRAPRAPKPKPSAQQVVAPVTAREVYERMRDETPGIKPNAAAIHREINSSKNEATLRRDVNAWWTNDPRNPKNQLHAVHADDH